MVRDAEQPDEVFVQDANASAGDCPHGQLLVAGHAQLAHDEDVQGHVQGLRDLERDGGAAARQREHKDVGLARVPHQALGEEGSGFAAIAESHAEP